MALSVHVSHMVMGRTRCQHGNGAVAPEVITQGGSTRRRSTDRCRRWEEDARGLVILRASALGCVWLSKASEKEFYRGQ